MTTRYSKEQKEDLVADLVCRFGLLVQRKDLIEFAETNSYPFPHWILNDASLKASRGVFNLETLQKSLVENSSKPKRPKKVPVAVEEPNDDGSVLFMKKLHQNIDSAIPKVDSQYVPFGFHSDLVTIISSGMFYPVFISGLSGNGKTTMVEQVAAKLKREVFRVNISIETDEDALIGSQTLVDGNVVYREGPALMAMRRGAILLLDEIDRGSNKLICLQAILEGKPYFNKRTGEMIYPKPGFTVIATANTKGSGSEDGRFAAAQILDEAFLERFAISHEQEYPNKAQEMRIIRNNMKKLSLEDSKFENALAEWVDIVRKSFKEGAVEEVVTTRRVVNIIQAYAMFKDSNKAIAMCLTRYNDDSRSAFIKMWEALQVPSVQETKLSAGVDDDLAVMHAVGELFKQAAS